MRKHRSSESINHFKAVQRFKSNVVVLAETIVLLSVLLMSVMKQSTVGTILFSIVDIIVGITVLILYSCYHIDSRNNWQSAIFRVQNPHASSVEDDEENANANSVSVIGITNPLINQDTKPDVELTDVKSPDNEDN